MKLQHTSWIWLVAPALLCALGAFTGHAVRTYAQPSHFAAAPLVNRAELLALEGATASAVANAAWAFADGRTAKDVMYSEVGRLYERSGLEKARALVRLAILDQNPDGRSSLFAQACTAHPPVCDDRRAAAQREIEARFVAPGNSLPLGMLEGGHPPIDGDP